MFGHAINFRPAGIPAPVLAVLGVVAWIYWPVGHAGFVWDDQLCFHDAAWLRQGDSWKHYLFRDFCDWTNYFRPLAVAVLTAQVRAFGSMPGPMHMVSLAMHLLNTLLVALLADRISTGAATRKSAPAAFAALGYGLHPALIDPVSWVACQAEMLVVLFTLSGLLINSAVRSGLTRAVSVSVCFFLAACSKESAFAFPLLLVVFDLVQEDANAWRARVAAVVKRQWPVYACVLIGGIAYLIFRQWAMGYIVHASDDSSPGAFTRSQEIAATYLAYWRILIWPMLGQSPIHPFDAGMFATASAGCLATDAAALLIAGLGFHAAYWKKFVGYLIVVVSVALIPVLHLIPVSFDESLYHERYVMMALAAGCVFLPYTIHDFSRLAVSPPHRMLLRLLLAGWLALALINIRVTVPLWSSDLALWEWAHRQYPGSLDASDRLLSAYIHSGNRAGADQLAGELLSAPGSCPICLLNVANLALAEHDASRAETALDKLKDAPLLTSDVRFLHGYILARGEVAELQGDLTAAEDAYVASAKLDPMDPVPQLARAHLLVKKGDLPQARKIADEAISLFAPDERDARRHAFEQIAASAIAR